MDQPAHQIKRRRLTPPRDADDPVPSPAANGGGYPRWVILDHYGEREGERRDEEADANTAASSRTSAGHPFTVSFCLAAPPALSALRFQFPGGDRGASSGPGPISFVIAAHADSALIGVSYELEFPHRTHGLDYFVYTARAAGADASRPPSLSILPPCYLTDNVEEGDGFLLRLSRRGPPSPRRPRAKPHDMDDKATGILRRRDRDDGDDLVVAELTVKPTGDSCMLNEADLLVFRSGEWRSIRAMPISHASSSSPSTRWPWKTDMVVPVGDRLLCWVDLYHGFIFSDVFDDNPRLQYVPLPEPPAMDTEGEPRCDSDSDDDDDDDRRRPPCPTLSRTVGATDGGAALKFVDVSPRCCCGSRAATFCHTSRLAFVIRTWTLKIGHDGDSSNMAWNMDAMVDATELWALDAYAGLPRVHVEHPLVSMDDPHLIRFVVCEEFQRRNFGHKKSRTWMIMVDTRRKTMTSVTTRLGFGRQPYPGSTYLPSGFSDYFNSYRGGSNVGGASSSTSEIAIAEPRTNGIAVNSPLRISCSSGSSSSTDLKVASPEEIFMTLERIPEMARDDLLKAYTILNQDNGRWFRSLLGLPMSLRKDWLLMMIKIQE